MDRRTEQFLYSQKKNFVCRGNNNRAGKMFQSLWATSDFLCVTIYSFKSTPV